jgi:hypothetical protein
MSGDPLCIQECAMHKAHTYNRAYHYRRIINWFDTFDYLLAHFSILLRIVTIYIRSRVAWNLSKI